MTRVLLVCTQKIWQIEFVCRISLHCGKYDCKFKTSSFSTHRQDTKHLLEFVLSTACGPINAKIAWLIFRKCPKNPTSILKNMFCKQKTNKRKKSSVNNSERNCAHVSTFQTLVAQKIPKWRIFLCTRNKIQKLFPYELNLFLEKFDI